MRDSVDNLRAKILIAMPSLGDPNFSKTITLICEHSIDQGAMGIILNLPTSLRLSELLNQIDIYNEKNTESGDTYVHYGGPVGMDQAFILHADNNQFESTLNVSERLSLSTSKDAFESISQSKELKSTIATLGYAGWTPGQLEAEILSNSWLVVDFNHDLVFNTPPSKQWLAAGDSLGINLNLLKCDAGHA
ncbi:MAG: YqgE/AlgH family protein [Pseudomonadota bacterium]